MQKSIYGFTTLTLATLAFCCAVTTQASVAPAATANVAKLTEQLGCGACHGINDTVLGPSFKDIAAKYKNDAEALARLSNTLKKGGVGVWDETPMPAQTQLTDAEIKTMLEWILSGAN
jgi:cytochrome c